MVRLPGPTSCLRKLNVLKQSLGGLAKIGAINLPNRGTFVARVQQMLLRRCTEKVSADARVRWSADCARHLNVAIERRVSMRWVQRAIGKRLFCCNGAKSCRFPKIARWMHPLLPWSLLCGPCSPKRQPANLVRPCPCRYQALPTGWPRP